MSDFKLPTIDDKPLTKDDLKELVRAMPWYKSTLNPGAVYTTWEGYIDAEAGETNNSYMVIKGFCEAYGISPAGLEPRDSPDWMITNQPHCGLVVVSADTVDSIKVKAGVDLRECLVDHGALVPKRTSYHSR